MKSSRSLLSALGWLAGLLLLLNAGAQSQDVPTWHYDNNRTGWQQNETALTPASLGTGFGMLWKASNLVGSVYAEPLTVSNVAVQGNPDCPCDLVLVATEQDVLYAFIAQTGEQVWSINLANQVPGGDYVYCPQTAIVFSPCDEGNLGDSVGITGTPVVDPSTNLMYLVAAVSQAGTVNYYLFAVNIKIGQIVGYIQVTGTVTGQTPASNKKCTSTFPSSGTISFDSNHMQRSSLLLLNDYTVYFSFGPNGDEFANGWLFGYSFTPHEGLGTFSQIAAFVPTPYGTGGGMWQSGGGLAAETVQGNTYIYVATGNGTFDPNTLNTRTVDLGDSFIKLLVTNDGSLTLADYYTASDNLSYTGGLGAGRCRNNVDFGSGAIMLFPEAFYLDQNHNTNPNMAVAADKESKLYVLNRDKLGHFVPSGAGAIETVQTPPKNGDDDQGYWAGPAYWKFIDGSGAPNYRLYYSVTTTDKTVAPHPIDMYNLITSGTTGPIPSQPSVSSSTLFCIKSPTPSVSSNGTMENTGILWAIQHPNTDANDCNGPSKRAVLKAFDATSMAEIYSSDSQYTLGLAAVFSTPTIYKGQVFIGTTSNTNIGELDVFGLCGQPSKCQ